MFRVVGPLAMSAAIGAALLVPSSAPAVVSDPYYQCPSVFEIAFTYSNGEFGPADRNLDGWSCRKSVGANGRYVFIDNTIPGFVVTDGVTDTGSTVLVDTATGTVVGG